MKKMGTILFKTARILLIVYVGLCVVMWSVQGALLFPASHEMTRDPSALDIPFEEVRLPVDGKETYGWYAPLENARGTVLFSHGNAGNLSGRVRMVERLQGFGFSVLAYDYGGYGHSTGSPSEARCYADIRAMWDYLVNTKGIPAQDILLYGKSVGGGPTSELAKDVNEGAVILESTFLSTTDVAWAIPLYRPFLWLLKHKFNNKDKVAEFNSPLLILHSMEDEVIPYVHAEENFKRAKEPKTFVTIKGGHNDGYEFSEKTYRKAWEEFLTPIFGEKPVTRSELATFSASELVDRYRASGTPPEELGLISAVLLEEHQTEYSALNNLAWHILTATTDGERDLALAMKASKAAYDACDGNEPPVVGTYARAHFASGNVDEAIDLQEKAIKLCVSDYCLARYNPVFHDALEEYIIARGTAYATQNNTATPMADGGEINMDTDTQHPFPELVIGVSTGISRWTYDKDGEGYRSSATVDMATLLGGSELQHEDALRLSSAGTHIALAVPMRWASDDYGRPDDSTVPRPSVYLLDRDLQVTARKEFEHIAALTSNDTTVFACAEKALISLDLNLEELCRLPLNCGTELKDAHDILVHEGTAYLLDNIYEPMYLFRVDVQAPRHLAVRRMIEAGGANSHLEHQWLWPDTNQWAVVTDFSVMTGYGQDLDIYDSERGEKPLFSQDITFHPRSEDFPVESKVPKSEFIAAVTPLQPTWAVLVNVDGTVNLAAVAHADDAVKFTNVLDLKSLGFTTAPKIQRAGKFLVLLASIDESRVIVALLEERGPQEPPELRHQQLMELDNRYGISELLALPSSRG